MAQTTTIGVQQFTSVDIQTVFYNRGTVAATPPRSTPLSPATSRIQIGNLIESSSPGQAIRDGGVINAIHGRQAFISVSGYRWRQYRNLAVSGTYVISPRFDCESSLRMLNSAGDSAITFNLTDASLVPGMKFGVARLYSAGNLVITFTNGTIMGLNGTTGSTLTITQYGHVVLRFLGGAVPSGPRIMLEEAVNATVT
jgi:hypothetical protein